MTRLEATQELRALLDEHQLRDWKVRLSTDMRAPLGLCSYKDKTIILNAFHIDTHPSIEVSDTIKHEVAHALCVGAGHNDVWKAKALELGCRNSLPCATYALSQDAIEAIRSGDQLEIGFEEHKIITPTYKIHKFVDKCEQCSKVFVTKTIKELSLPKKRIKITTGECGHVRITDCDSQSPFEQLVFDDDINCKHEWGIGKYRTRCTQCDAKKLYEYQIEGARFLEKANGNGALFDEMGLGKTIQFLAYLKYNSAAFPYLWVTKSGIKYQHCKEIIRLLGPTYMPQVITKGHQTLIKGMKGYLVSWDMFRRMPDLSIFEGIQSVFLDECQAMSNPDSARTQAIRKVCKLIPRRVPASGTFWKNRGSEAFVALNMLAPDRFGSYKRFKTYDVEYYTNSAGKEKEGGLRAGLMNEIKDIAIRRERKQVMPELPDTNRMKLTCEVPEHARELYAKEEQNLINTYNALVIDGAENSFAGNAAMLQSLIIMRQIVGIAKVDTTVELTKEFLEETDRKLIIFVHHKRCGLLISSQLTEYCKENGIAEPLILTSQTDGMERFAIQNKFNGPNHRLLIASTLASGEGLNLQSCSDIFMHERQWNPGNEQQAEDRTARIGQEANKINVTYIHGEDTCDTELNGIVEGKRVRFHNSMNKGQMPSWNQDELVLELAKRIAEKRKKKTV